jgi:hypothetical protein
MVIKIIKPDDLFNSCMSMQLLFIKQIMNFLKCELLFYTKELFL